MTFWRYFDVTILWSMYAILSKSFHVKSFPITSIHQRYIRNKYSIFSQRFHHEKTSNSGESYFVETVTSWLRDANITYGDISEQISSPYTVVGIGKVGDCFKVGLHIIPYPSETNIIDPTLCKTLTDNETLPVQTIIHLHEDVWNRKNDIVKARLAAKVNRVNHRWYARKTRVQRIDIITTMDFLNEHHLWGATRSKFNYGLFDTDDELIAVATFSPRRHVNRAESSRPYRSHELIRYCAKKDGHVIGGITKLVSAFCRELAPDDLVTCIDRDWGSGEGWQPIGFDKVAVMPPLVMAVDNNSGIPIRKYMVGAGIGSKENDSNNEKNGRPGIPSDVFIQLGEITDDNGALEVLRSNNLFPVYDAGVERRLLVIENTKLETQASMRREELGLDDIIHEIDVKDSVEIWQKSKPSFPADYYSSNTGINSLLIDAKI